MLASLQRSRWTAGAVRTNSRKKKEIVTTAAAVQSDLCRDASTATQHADCLAKRLLASLRLLAIVTRNAAAPPGSARRTCPAPPGVGGSLALRFPDFIHDETSFPPSPPTPARSFAHLSLTQGALATLIRTSRPPASPLLVPSPPLWRSCRRALRDLRPSPAPRAPVAVPRLTHGWVTAAAPSGKNTFVFR